MKLDLYNKEELQRFKDTMLTLVPALKKNPEIVPEPYYCEVQKDEANRHCSTYVLFEGTIVLEFGRWTCEYNSISIEKDGTISGIMFNKHSTILEVQKMERSCADGYYTSEIYDIPSISGDSTDEWFQDSLINEYSTLMQIIVQMQEQNKGRDKFVSFGVDIGHLDNIVGDTQ